MKGTIRETSIVAVRMALRRETAGRGFQRKNIREALECALRFIADDEMSEEFSTEWSIPDNWIRNRSFHHGRAIEQFIRGLDAVNTPVLGPDAVRMLAEHLKYEMVEQFHRYLQLEFRRTRIQQAVPA